MLSNGGEWYSCSNKIDGTTGWLKKVEVYALMACRRVLSTGWLEIKYSTGEYAISPQPVVWFYKFLKLLENIEI